jgi:hypothetical protein
MSDLFSDLIHNSERAGLNGKMINKLIGKYVDGRSNGLILGIIPTFSGLMRKTEIKYQSK